MLKLNRSVLESIKWNTTNNHHSYRWSSYHWTKAELDTMREWRKN